MDGNPNWINYHCNSGNGDNTCGMPQELDSIRWSSSGQVPSFEV